MKLLISALGKECIEKVYDFYDEPVIKKDILNYCIQNSITKCNYRIDGEADCLISLHNTNKLTALFG